MSHAMQGHPGWTGHSDKFCGPLEDEMEPTPVFLPQESHEQYEKAKDMTPKDEPTGSESVQYATGEEWQLLIAPEGMKQLGQNWK